MTKQKKKVPIKYGFEPKYLVTINTIIMKEKEQVMVKEVFGRQFSGRTGIITGVDNNGFNVLLDLGVEIYFNEGEIKLL